jgi:hypothetical protein
LAIVEESWVRQAPIPQQTIHQFRIKRRRNQGQLARPPALDEGVEDLCGRKEKIIIKIIIIIIIIIVVVVIIIIIITIITTTTTTIIIIITSLCMPHQVIGLYNDLSSLAWLILLETVSGRAPA